MLQQATQCVSQLIRIAVNKRRNYIIDQVMWNVCQKMADVFLCIVIHVFPFSTKANIYPSAQRHKMMCFHGYKRKAVVVFPGDEEWKRRLVQHQEEEGTTIPETSLLKAKGQTATIKIGIKVQKNAASHVVFNDLESTHLNENISFTWFPASFTLPEQGEHLDEVMFVELCFDEAWKLLTQYKEEARNLLPTPPKRKKHRHGNHKRLIHHCGKTRLHCCSYSIMSFNEGNRSP